MEIPFDLRLFIYAHFTRSTIKAQNRVLVKMMTIFRLQRLLSIEWYWDLFDEFERMEEEAAVV